jgi:hypothetical protein
VSYNRLGIFLGTLISSINKTDHHDIAEILLKVALNNMILILNPRIELCFNVFISQINNENTHICGLFISRSEMFFRTTQELELFFFCRAKFFSQNLTLAYMTKTLNQIFFSPPKSEYFFSNIGNSPGS